MQFCEFDNIYVASETFHLHFCISVQLQDVPPDALSLDNIDEQNPDERISQLDEDKRIEPNNEFYDGDNDVDNDVEMNES